MIANRTTQPTFATGFAPARRGMHCGRDLQVRGIPPFSGGRLAL